MAPNLPGFYYDETKRKYFKIQPNHKARHGESIYTNARITRVQEQQQREEDAEKEAAVQSSSCLKRTPIWQFPEMVAPLLRSSGLRLSKPPLRDAVDLHMYQSGHKFKMARTRIGTITAIHVDIDADYALVGDSCGQVDYWEPGLVRRPAASCLLAGPGMVTSLSVNSRHHSLWTMHGAWSFGVIDQDSQSIRATVYDQDRVFHSCALNTHLEQFVVGVDELMLVSNLYRPNLLATRHNPNLIFESHRFSSPADTLAVDWHTPHVAAGGRRDGRVLLLDTRVASSVVRLQFPSAITKLQSVGSNEILLAGLGEQMHLYDLRWTPPICGSTQFRAETMLHRVRDAEQAVARPVCSYSHYKVKERTDLGWAVDLEQGLIASADEYGGVRIMGLWDGELVPHRTLNSATFSDSIKAITFVRGEGSIALGLTNGKIEVHRFARADSETKTGKCKS